MRSSLAQHENKECMARHWSCSHHVSEGARQTKMLPAKATPRGHARHYTCKDAIPLTLCTPSSLQNSMKAKRMAELGSPHTRQSTICPHSLNMVASCSSVACSRQEVHHYFSDRASAMLMRLLEEHVAAAFLRGLSFLCGQQPASAATLWLAGVGRHCEAC